MVIANPINPRKKFTWTLEFDGLTPALAQRVIFPKLTVEKAEHGAANVIIKTGGMLTIDDIEVNKLMFSNKNENWAYNWMREVSDPETGQMGIPSEYKRNGYIMQFAPDNVTVLEKWQLFGCWPTEIEKEELDRTSSENMIEKVMLSVDYVVKS